MKKLISSILMLLTLLCGSNIVWGIPTKGVQAILLHRWGATSVRNLSNTLRTTSNAEVEVSFAPNTAAKAPGNAAFPVGDPRHTTDPYKNVRTIISNLRSKKMLYVTVYLGFHSYSNSAGCGNRSANSELDQFILFFSAYKNNPKVQITVSPSLEDCGTRADVEESAEDIAMRVGTADIGKLILRRSSNGSGDFSAPSRCYFSNAYCFKSVYANNRVEVERHGPVALASSATVYSNDGYFVWDNVSRNPAPESASSFGNADGSTANKYSLSNFTSLTAGKRTNLWRPAYNMYRKCDGHYYTNGSQRDFKDCNNRAFNGAEISVLKKFLDPIRTSTLTTTGGMNLDLTPGDSVNSENDEVTLMFQTDGNVVLYNNDTGEALWNTQTSGRTDATRFVMQSDGNLVLYAGTTPLWYAGIISPGAYLAIQDDHNMVIYTANGVAFWHTATTGQ